ncbi:hypothetical protein ACFFKU_03060 [Kineococcus gynurae]|uniref:Uncharacterized protein n=1 Tax=Kineococcus gynurae TaxID=452979 RepID=A0ABV5LS64_9ACTN
MIGRTPRPRRGPLPSEVGAAVVGRLMLAGGAGGLVVGGLTGAAAITFSDPGVAGLRQIATIYGAAAGTLAGIALALVVALLLHMAARFRQLGPTGRYRLVTVPVGAVAVLGSYAVVTITDRPVQRVLVAAAIGLLAAGLARLAAPWCLSPEQAPGR